MNTALALAASSSLCFGIALVTGRLGLRSLDARSGAAISIPTATVILVLLAPFRFDAAGFSLTAALLFAAVGVFFPAVVTLLTFRANEALGPTVTGAVSGTAPLFALVAASLILGERVPAQAALASVTVVFGIVLLSWKKGSTTHFDLASLAWPISGALLRGLAQAVAKAGLLLWPNPFMASLIGYLISTVVVVSADRWAGRERTRADPCGILWFAITGILNGSAVLLMYAALGIAPVALVAPVVASYPLITALASALFLRTDTLTPRMLAGAIMIVGAIIFLVAS